MVKARLSEDARRLAVVRFMIAGNNQTVFARKMDIEVKRWNNFERGIQPLSKEVAIRLVQRIQGLTLDYLHLGRWEGLPGIMRTELERAAVELDESATATARKR